MARMRIRRRALPQVLLAPAASSAAAGTPIADTVFVDGFERCSDAAGLIYAFDAGGTLLRFDPRLVATPAQSIAALGGPACTLGPPLPGYDNTAPLSMAVDPLGQVWAMYSQDWAFAHWGGTFWIFLNNGIGTALVSVNIATGRGAFVFSVPYTPVAAATSTCAPVAAN